MNDGSIMQAQSEQIRKERLMHDMLRMVADKMEAAGKDLRLTLNTTSDLNTLRGAAMAVGPDLEASARLLLAATQGL